MEFNRCVSSLALDLSQFNPDWLEGAQSRTDRVPLDLFRRYGPLECWFCDELVPQFPRSIRDSCDALTLRGDAWDFSKRPPNKPQFWHFDFPNFSYRAGFQAIVILGGNAETDVLSPCEFDSPAGLMDFLLRNPEGFSYQSYPVGTLLYSDEPFCHRRGPLKSPCFRYGFDLAQVFSRPSSHFVMTH